MTTSVTRNVTSPLIKGGNVTLRWCYGVTVKCYGEWVKATGKSCYAMLRHSVTGHVTADVTLIMSTCQSYGGVLGPGNRATTVTFYVKLRGTERRR